MSRFSQYIGVTARFRIPQLRVALFLFGICPITFSVKLAPLQLSPVALVRCGNAAAAVLTAEEAYAHVPS